MAKVVNICDVCNEIFAGGDAPKNNMSVVKTEEYTIPIYSNGEANDGLYGFTNYSRVNEPSITISARGTIGYTSIRTTPFVPIVRLITLVPKPEVINIKYLYYAAQNYKFDGSGTSIPQLTVPALKKYNFPLPNLEEQKQIVIILDKICDLIADRKKQLMQLDNLVKSRFIEMFGNRGENPYKFPTTTMGNVYKFQYGKGNNIPEDKGEYPCYGSNGVVGHHTEYNSEDAPVIGHIGAYAGIVNWGKGKHYVTYNGVICKLINDQVNPVYGYYLLQLQDYNTVAKSGAAQPFVSYKDLDAPVVNVPQIDLQNQFAEFVEQTDKLKFEVKQSLEKLETLKKSLMQQYFG